MNQDLLIIIVGLHHSPLNPILRRPDIYTANFHDIQPLTASLLPTCLHHSLSVRPVLHD